MKKQTLPILGFLLFLLTSNSIFAAYLRNVPVKITQPDGQVIDCFATGDEFYNWLHDEQNYTIIKDPENGFYVFADLEDGKLAPSELIVGKDDPQDSGIEPGINVFPEKASLKSAQVKLKSNYLTTGDFNNIVIFIRFADQDEYNTSVSNYQNLFNGADFSLTDYFQVISGNQLNISSTFYPTPHNGWVLSYQDSYNRNYYLEYDAATNPHGYSNIDELTEREHTLLQNAVKFVKPAIEASGINFDADQDGFVDNISFIIQGNVEGWSELLWPHRWALYSKQVFINDARVWDYNFHLSEKTKVSVLCHEMFHTLGAPDLYHYNSAGIIPVGGWDLMAYDNAQHSTTWLKHKYGNWFQNIPEINANGTYKLAAVSVNPFACFKIPVPETSTEFFMVEYRKKSGYDANLFGNYDEGLLVYRVNPLIYGNADGPPDEVFVLRPGISENLSAGYYSEAAFSDINNRDVLTSTSDPYPFLEDGTKSSFSIYDVKLMGDSIEFKFHNGEPLVANFETSATVVSQGENVEFTDFSSGTPTSWHWNFGDGQFSSEQNPAHNYLQPGDYTVKLIVSNDFFSDTILKENYINVLPLPDCPQHFHPIWEGTAGYDQMNINVLGTQLDGMDLRPGDEIGIFDGELCVGFGKVEQTIDLENVLMLIASRDDGTGNGFISGNSITYKFWDCNAWAEFPVQSALYFNNLLEPVAEPTFNAGGTAFVELNSTSEVCFELNYSSGWNLSSVPVFSEPSNIKDLFQPLIDNTSLVKIQDELGSAVEDWGIIGGWKNFIGEIDPTEGYKIKMNFNDSFEVCGKTVEYPFAIPLSSGWNIIGFPQTIKYDALEVVQNLIDNGTLLKVQDEQGSAIEDFGMIGGWKNFIGELTPGRGYKIKLAAADTLWIHEAYSKSAGTIPQSVSTSFFTRDFMGNGVDHMNINIAGLPANILQPGDELAVFDGGQCVGAVTLLPWHLNSRIVSIAASAADDSGMPGFTEGNEFTLKLWSTKQHLEFELEPEILKGPGFFVKHESTLLSLEKYATTGTDGLLLPGLTEIICYPNPFSDEITIEINLAEDYEVQVEILNQLGQKVRTLMTPVFLNQGLHRLNWNGQTDNSKNTASGIYHFRIRIDDSIIHRKIVLLN